MRAPWQASLRISEYNQTTQNMQQARTINYDLRLKPFLAQATSAGATGSQQHGLRRAAPRPDEFWQALGSECFKVRWQIW